MSPKVLLLVVAAIVVGCVSVGALAAQEPPGAAAQAQAPATDNPDIFLKWYVAQPRVKLPVAADGAAVLIVKFTDLQCPVCGLVHQAYKPILARYEKDYPGAVKQVIKNFPLDPQCNAYVSQQLHPAACDAAVALILARRRGVAPALEDWMYSNQEVMTPQTVRKAASLIADVSPTDFDAGYASAMTVVKADTSMGGGLDISGTPTFFINGVKIGRAMDPKVFEAVIQYELKRAGKIK